MSGLSPGELVWLVFGGIGAAIVLWDLFSGT